MAGQPGGGPRFVPIRRQGHHDDAVGRMVSAARALGAVVGVSVERDAPATSILGMIEWPGGGSGWASVTGSGRGRCSGS